MPQSLHVVPVAYLGRYTHRTAISNPRILRVDDRKVTFSIRDPDRPGRKKTVALAGAEFLRRFFFHVLPGGFTRIRHYGFLAGGVRHQRLTVLRSALGQKASDVEPVAARLERICGGAIDRCPHCKTGRLVLFRSLPKGARAPP